MIDRPTTKGGLPTTDRDASPARPSTAIGRRAARRRIAMRDGAGRSLAVLSLTVDGGRTITPEGGVAIELHWPVGRREWFVLVGVAGTTEPFDDNLHDVTLAEPAPVFWLHVRDLAHVRAVGRTSTSRPGGCGCGTRSLASMGS